MQFRVRPFLMFQNADAEQAMNFYAGVFPDAKITDIKRYGPNQPGAEGTVIKATFSIGDQDIHCIDSPVKHAFGFTPAVSLFVDCESRDQLETIVAALAEGGAFLMPPDNYGFSQRFAWLNDRFGVSWQINLP